MGFGGLLGGLLGGGRSGDGTEEYLKKINDVGNKYYTPYIEHGQGAYNQLEPHYNEMLNNPTGFLDALFSEYRPSAGYQAKQKDLLQAARNSAASGGFAGTDYDQKGQAELVDALLSQDMQQYIQNVLGVQGTGMKGYEDLEKEGFLGSQGLADLLGSNYGQLGGLELMKDRQNQQNKMDMLGLLSGGLGLFGGGNGSTGGGSGGGKFDWKNVLLKAGLGYAMGGPAGAGMGALSGIVPGSTKS